MVFMADSERAAKIAQDRSIDTGLHLNLTQAFTSPNVPSQLAAHQQRVSGYLMRSRYARALFHPGLAKSFEYLVASQLEEYHRLYGASPDRIDGHHHMHQCANVVLQNLLPAGTLVRRNYSFRSGEKSLVNRFYRKVVDFRLARRHRLVNYFFSLPPFDDSEQTQKILLLAQDFTVEVAAHPAVPEDFRALTGGEILHWIDSCPIATGFVPALHGNLLH